ncbi:MAG: Arylsulfatase [Streptosporangiaceae bacterium]|nr:Arylsulfatase [Streptosporangiaceae bacterium]
MSARIPISRRAFLSGSATTVAAATVPGLLPARASAGTSRPNILLVITDDQPRQTEWATPQTMDWLAGQGTEYTHAFATTPLCAPSRASIFTGQYAHNHGVRGNRQSARLDHSRTVHRYLQQAGYRTGLYGKFLNGWKAGDNPPFFEDWAVLARPTYDNGVWNVNGVVQSLPDYTTTVVEHRALGFLQRTVTDSRPWFLCLSPYAPHGPNKPDRRYAGTEVPDWQGRPSVFETDKTDKPPYIQHANATPGDGAAVRAAQLRTLRSVDDMVAAVHGRLEALGQLDNTLVFFIGDNGFSWADHGWHRKSVPYAPSVRVPFYVSWPAAGLNTGRPDDRLVANIDIAPTVLEAAGLMRTGRFALDGHSLLAPYGRDRLLLEWWRQKSDERPHSWASLVTADRQYTEYYDTRLGRGGRPAGSGKVMFREYYDLARDPGQLANLLHGATPEQEADLRIPALSARLALDRTCTGTTEAPVPGHPPSP